MENNQAEIKLRTIVAEVICIALKLSAIVVLAMMVLAWWIITP